MKLEIVIHMLFNEYYVTIISRILWETFKSLLENFCSVLILISMNKTFLLIITKLKTFEKKKESVIISFYDFNV